MPARRRRSSLFLTGLVGLGVALVASGCSEGPLDVFQGKGSQSQIINTIQKPVFLVAIIVGILVMAAIVFIVIKFRAKPGDDELPAQTHGALGLELGWTILPAVILAFVAVGTVVTIFKLADQPENAMHVNVYGQQWWWGFEYDVQVNAAVGLGGSLFTDVHEASRFFESGAVGLSPSRDGSLEGLTLSTDAWRVEPVRVEWARSSFFDDPDRFPPGSVELDCGLLMRSVPVRWTATSAGPPRASRSRVMVR